MPATCRYVGLTTYSAKIDAQFSDQTERRLIDQLQNSRDLAKTIDLDDGVRNLRREVRDLDA